MTTNRALQVSENFDASRHHNDLVSAARRSYAEASDVNASGDRSTPVVLRARAGLPFGADAANDPSGGDVNHLDQQTATKCWRAIWCNGYRYLSTRDLATYPPTVVGFGRAIKVLTPLIRSLVDDPDHRQDARSSSTDRSLSCRASAMRVEVVSVRRARPSPATLGRWVREGRTR